jgi:DNA-directed RNA polymerase specialized sigma24 family protein
VDVGLSAFNSCCRGAAQGRFSLLADRHGLWRLLPVSTERRAADLVKYGSRAKQGGRQTLPEAALPGQGSAGDGLGLANLPGPEPDPAFAAQVAQEYRRPLDRLGDDELRAIAVVKMEGYTNEQLAERLGCALATVERRLRVIRKSWERDLPPRAGA